MWVCECVCVAERHTLATSRAQSCRPRVVRFHVYESERCIVSNQNAKTPFISVSTIRLISLLPPKILSIPAHGLSEKLLRHDFIPVKF